MHYCQSFWQILVLTVLYSPVPQYRLNLLGGMRREPSGGVQAFTICPGSCPRLGHLPWDPYVYVSRRQLCRACLLGPLGLQGGSANGRTHTVGRPGHQCLNEGQLWNLRTESKACFNALLQSIWHYSCKKVKMARTDCSAVVNISLWSKAKGFYDHRVAMLVI